MSGHGQCSLPDTRSSDNRESVGAARKSAKTPAGRDTRWNQVCLARHTVPTRILLFTRTPEDLVMRHCKLFTLRFSSAAKSRATQTQAKPWKSNTRVQTMLDASTRERIILFLRAYSLTTKTGGAREGWLGRERIGARQDGIARPILSSYISSFCDRRNTHRDKSEKRELEVVHSHLSTSLVLFTYLMPALLMKPNFMRFGACVKVATNSPGAQ